MPEFEEDYVDYKEVARRDGRSKAELLELIDEIHFAVCRLKRDLSSYCEEDPAFAIVFGPQPPNRPVSVPKEKLTNLNRVLTLLAEETIIDIGE